MALKQEEVTITGTRGSFGGYFAAPADGTAPGVLVVQEIFGVNPHIRSVVDRLAEEGYAALAPDFFWPVKPGVQLGYEGEELQEAIGLMGQVDLGNTVDDAKAALAYLTARPETQGRKQGITGFCWGGLVTYLVAARLNPDCAVSYYGGRIANFLDEASNISCPITFHFGDQDQSISMDQVAQITEAVKDLPNTAVYVYEGAGHGFHCDVRASYNEAGARQAWQRTMEFFKTHLGA
jgi:carboxymethylenebutenolidase